MLATIYRLPPTITVLTFDAILYGHTMAVYTDPMKLAPQSAREMARRVNAVGATTDCNAALCYDNVWYTMRREASNLVFLRTDLRSVRVLPICMTRKEIAINVRPELIEPLRHLLWCVRELMPTTGFLRCIVCNQHCKLLHFQCTHRVHAACAHTLHAHGGYTENATTCNVGCTQCTAGIPLLALTL